MPTIHDVAERAGVAAITVSRVINNSGYVSPATRERVERAIVELQYVPNSLARGLRLKKTWTIALLVTDITNPFWTVVVRGVEDVANKSGFHMILCNTDEAELKQARYLNLLLEKQVDGILLVPARSRAEPVELLRQQGIAVVVLDRQVPSAEVDVVRCDSEAGAYQLVRHLVGLGHRRIAVLTGPPGVSTAEERVAGYCRAMGEAGLAVDEELICCGEFRQATGAEMMQRLLLKMPWPTAVFAANNFLAVGAYRTLRDVGLRVPEDISLVAFDDLPAGLVFDPFLTVVFQPAYEMGRRAAELLLARLAGDAPPAYQHLLLPTEMIVRRSSTPPRWRS